MKKILVTGVAGFIGYHLTKKLLKKHKVFGVDNINKYYDIKIKLDRLKNLNNKNFFFKKIDITQKKKLEVIFKKYKPDIVINLAAQAGVRYSLKKPIKYINYNIIGFQNILDLSVKYSIKALLFASSSSVYGRTKNKILSENDRTDKPISVYGVTKKTNEMMAYCYSSLYNLPTFGFRLFTVYGPWGRPDMSLFKFVSNILKNKKIYLFNNGKHERDFTYVDDVVAVINRCVQSLLKNKISKKYFDSEKIPHQIFNISGNKATTLFKYVKIISFFLKKEPKINFLPMQMGDVVKTKADIKKIKNLFYFNPKINLKTGILRFVNWYKKYY
jgi:UDP-glucuronate 4-epimerase